MLWREPYAELSACLTTSSSFCIKTARWRVLWLDQSDPALRDIELIEDGLCTV